MSHDMALFRQFIVKKHTIFIIASIAVLFFIALAPKVHAATITWDGGGGDENWDTCDNWSTNTCPTSSDTAQFNSTSVKNATINTNITITSFNINSGYTGIVTQSANIDMSGSFTLNDGTYTWSSGSWNVQQSFDVDNGATLNLTGATVTFDGGYAQYTNLYCTGTFPAAIVISKSSNAYFSIASGCTVVNPTISSLPSLYVYGTLDPPSSTSVTNFNIYAGGTVTFDPSDTFTLGSGISNSGTLTLPNAPTFTTYTGTGSTTHPGTTWGGTGSVTVSAGGTLNFTNATSWTLEGHLTVNSGGTLNYSSGTSWDINQGSFTNDGTIDYPGTTINVNQSFDNIDGTFDISSKTITFDGGYGQSTNLYCTGTFPASAVVSKSSSAYFTIQSGCTVVDPTISLTGSLNVYGTLDSPSSMSIGSLSVRSGGTVTFDPSDTLISSGTIDNDGTLTLPNAPTFSTYTGTGTTTHPGTTWGGTGSVTVNSGGTLNFTNATSWTIEGNLNVNSGGTLNYSSGTSWDINQSSFTNDGTIDYPGTTINVNYNFDTRDGTFDLSGKTITFDGSSQYYDSNLYCGSNFSSTTNVTVNKSNSGGSFDIDTDCTLGDFYFGGVGFISTPASSRALSVYGDITHTSGTFNVPNYSFTLTGTNDQIITQQGGSWSSPLQINKSEGTVTLATSGLTSSGACNVVEGTVDINGFDWTCSSGLTIEDGGILELYGSETVTTPTLDPGSTVRYTGNGDASSNSYSVKDWSYQGFIVAGVDSNDTFDATAITTLTLPVDFVHSGGIFSAPPTLNVAGDFTRTGGTFTHNSGSVVLNGTSQTISGDTTFGNFTKSVSSADTLTFTAGDRQTFAGTMTLTGAVSNLLTLVTSSSGTQWEIDPQSTRTIEYLDVSYSNNVNSTEITTANLNVEDSGNNTGWIFDAIAPTITNISSDTANGLYGDGKVIDIDVTFSESVTSTGNVTVTLETGENDRTCTFSISAGTSGSCNYVVQTGDSSYDLNVKSVSGTIADDADNAMINFTPATNLADNKNILINVSGNGPIFQGGPEDLEGYTIPRLQTIYPDGTIVYWDDLDDVSQIPSAQNGGVVGGMNTETQDKCVLLQGFTRNLKLGSRGSDVLELQILLNCLGFTLALEGAGSSGNETTYFGPLTRQAVISFQNTYAEEILHPVDLTEGTGFFGPSTRGFVENL